MHTANEVLKGITLPSDLGIVTGRIYNWLRDLNNKIKPASCFVMRVDKDFGEFFVSVATKLVESAGVNVVVDDVQRQIRTLKRLKSLSGRVTVFDSSDETQEDYSYLPSSQVYRVADSLMLSSQKSRSKFPNHISIFDSWVLAYDATINGLDVYFDFADVRLQDELSSGRQSFMAVCTQISKFASEPSLTEFLKCLSDICSTIKRGGFRRHGAMTASLESNSEVIEEYLNIPFGYLTHLKKGVLIRKRSITNFALIQQFIDKQNAGELFFEKEAGTSNGIAGVVPLELRSNVCRGLNLISGDQCLVSPVNLGMVREYKDIYRAFREVTEFLIDVHNKQIEDGHPILDKQIAVGICGLANMLRNFGVSYPEFIEALIVRNYYTSLGLGFDSAYRETVAFKLVEALVEGIHVAACIGRANFMRATLAIEPNESCSRRYKDWQGYDVCPNIDPPDVVPGVGIERRHSETGVYDNNGELIHPEFNYGKDIYPASQLTEKQHFDLWNEILKIFDETGQGHGGSYEQWYPLTFTSFLEWWNSSINHIYYNRAVGTRHLVKASPISARQRIVKATETKTACTLDMRGEGCPSCD